MRHGNILASSAAALAGLALAGCGVFAPEDSANAASAPPESASAVESEEHSTGLEHLTESSDDDPGLAEGAVRPEDATPRPEHEPAPVENSDQLPAPEDLNSDLMVAPGDDQQGSIGQPRGPHVVAEGIWQGKVPLWAECTDEAALAANAGHMSLPAGQ